MNKEFKKLWIDALRSGDYLQGKTKLRIGNTFCCLGVACDLITKNNLAPGTWVIKSQRYEFVVPGAETSSTASLPTAISRFMEVTPMGIIPGMETAVKVWAAKSGVTLPTAFSPTLSYLNDIDMPFEQIANIIEELF